LTSETLQVRSAPWAKRDDHHGGPPVVDDQAEFAGVWPVANECIGTIPAIWMVTAFHRELVFHAVTAVDAGSFHSLTVTALRREWNSPRPPSLRSQAAERRKQEG